MNFHLTADETAYILDDSGTSILFVGPETAERGLEAARIAGVETVVGWGDRLPDDITSWAAWLALGADGATLVRSVLALAARQLLPAVAVVLFWVYRQATPGKIAVGARIVDARTGDKPGTGQLVGRYLAYYVSIIPFMLGILWVAFDPRKQGWHDKLAGTVVVRTRRRGHR